MKNKIYVSWDEFQQMSKELSDKIKEDRVNFDGIYGIPVGAFPLTAYLRNHLELPYKKENEVTENTLIVDDISDCGNTLSDYGNNLIACLYSTPWTKTKPHWYSRMKEDRDSWIIFPWEKDEKTEKDGTSG